MIRSLRAEFNLAKSLMRSPGRFLYGLFEQLLRHKMRAGAGSEKATVFHKLQPAHIDVAVSLDCLFRSFSRLGKCRRIQDHDIKALAGGFQLRKKVEHIRTYETDAAVFIILRSVPGRFGA